MPGYWVGNQSRTAWHSRICATQLINFNLKPIFWRQAAGRADLAAPHADNERRFNG